MPWCSIFPRARHTQEHAMRPIVLGGRNRPSFLQSTHLWISLCCHTSIQLRTARRVATGFSEGPKPSSCVHGHPLASTPAPSLNYVCWAVRGQGDGRRVSLSACARPPGGNSRGRKRAGSRVVGQTSRRGRKSLARKVDVLQPRQSSSLRGMSLRRIVKRRFSTSSSLSVLDT